MRLELADLPIAMINLPHQNRRRFRARRSMDRLGLPFTIVDGVRDAPRHFGCSQGHLRAIEMTRGSGPFLIMEDDAIPTAHYQPQVEVPDGIDLLYLGHSQSGYSRSLTPSGTPELTELDGSGLLVVHSMLAAHAIIYVTEAGVDAVVQSIRKSMSSDPKERHDIGLCDLQRHLRVAATRLPFFCQSSDLQGNAKRDLRRLQEDFISQPRAVDDVVMTASGPLRVVRSASGRLEYVAAMTTADEGQDRPVADPAP
ncbi:MAG: hypothetical protein NTW20_06525 [Rhodobacterales bacterium]|nr:hypothetical protein [Rhodobacterales bacterium]